MRPFSTSGDTTKTRHNLLQSHAVTAADLDGRPVAISLAQAILDAHLYRDLVVPVPTMVPALLRQVLVPIVMDALGPMNDAAWEARFQRGKFDVPDRETISAYFTRHADRFDLFGDHGFGQTPGLTAKTGEVKPVSQLLPHIATGNNVPLFSPYTNATGPAFSPAEAFWAMVHCQCWDTAALKTGAVGDPKVAKNNTTSGNPTGPLGQLGVVVPLGRTLYDTLLLNALADAPRRANGDSPQWARERPPGPDWEERTPLGPLDLLTWQARRIRLIAEERPEGPVVTGVVCTAGDRINQLPEWEPHTLWKRSTKKARKGAYDPMRHRSGRAMWQGLDSLVALAHPTEASPVLTCEVLQRIGDLAASELIADDYPLRVATFGLEYGKHSSVVDNAIVDELPLPVAMLATDNARVRTLLLQAAEQADRLRMRLDFFQTDLRTAAGGDKLDWDKGSHAGAELIAALDIPARRLLAGFQAAGGDYEQLEAGMRAWEQVAWLHTKQIADSLLATVPPESLIAAGRKPKPAASGTSTSTGETEARHSTRLTTGPVERARRELRKAMRSVLPREAERRRLPPDDQNKETPST